MANPLVRRLLREVPEAAEGLAKRVAAQFAEREATAATRASAKDALEAIMRQAPEGVDFAAKPARSLAVAPSVPPTPVSFIPSSLAAKELPEITGKGGRSRRKTTPATIISDASRRVRAEAASRSASGATPAERRAARAAYSDPPVQIDPDPFLAAVQLDPRLSVTKQVAELGVPVVGAKPFFTKHSTGYSRSWGGNDPTPMNTTVEYRDRNPVAASRPLDESDLKVASGLFPMIGDNTGASRDVLSVNGIMLPGPVSLFGGSRFAQGQRAIGGTGGWGSDVARTEGYAKAIRDWMNENNGEDVFGLHVNMGPEGGDFSHQTGAVAANLLAGMNLPGDRMRAIDNYIRGTASGLSDFYGFADDPHAGLLDLLTRPGKDRATVLKRLGNVTKEGQAAGIPADIGALARIAAAEPGLRLAPQGATGHSMIKFDPYNLLQVNPEILSSTKRQLFTPASNEYGGILGDAPIITHPDYNALLTGAHEGHYENLLPVETVFRDSFERAAAFDKNGRPTSPQMKWQSFLTDPNPIQTVTPELQDAVGDYLYKVSKFKKNGWAHGGAVRALAGKYGL